MTFRLNVELLKGSWLFVVLFGPGLVELVVGIAEAGEAIVEAFPAEFAVPEVDSILASPGFPVVSLSAKLSGWLSAGSSFMPNPVSCSRNG